MISYEERQRREAVTRERAQRTVNRIYPALIARGVTGVDIHLALGEASADFPTMLDKLIWVDEIARYRQDNGIAA